MADNDTHARQRRALSHGFSQQALWGQEEIVQSYVTKLLNNFKSFCEGCARQYAAQEAYLMEGEIGDALELAR